MESTKSLQISGLKIRTHFWSEVTQIIEASLMLKNLFRGGYYLKWGGTGLEASSFRRNQEVESSTRRKDRSTDGCDLSLRSLLGQKLIVCEVSGPPHENDLEHFGEDKIKIQKRLKDMLNIAARRAEYGDADTLRELKVFGIQIFGWKDCIYMMDIPYKHKHVYRFSQIGSRSLLQSDRIGTLPTISENFGASFGKFYISIFIL